MDLRHLLPCYFFDVFIARITPSGIISSLADDNFNFTHLSTQTNSNTASSYKGFLMFFNGCSNVINSRIWSLVDTKAWFEIEFLKENDAKLLRKNMTTDEYALPYTKDFYAGWCAALKYLDLYNHIVLFESEIRSLFDAEYLGGNPKLSTKHLVTGEYDFRFIEHAWMGWQLAFVFVSREMVQAN